MPKSLRIPSLGRRLLLSAIVVLLPVVGLSDTGGPPMCEEDQRGRVLSTGVHHYLTDGHELICQLWPGQEVRTAPPPPVLSPDILT